jgi:hypothetical protein
MLNETSKHNMDQIRAIKSAFIIEAERLSVQGLEAFARPFYQEAAEGEIALASLFESLHRASDAKISLLSAGSCLLKARQFSRALPILKRVRKDFPEAQEMIRMCRGKDDEPLAADIPELRALVKLLIKKGLITEREWTEAFDTVSRS